MKAPSLFLRGHVPSSVLLLRTSQGTPNVKLHPILCFCKAIQTNSYEIVNGSYHPTAQQTKEKNTMEKPSRKIESIGAFQKLPIVMPSIDILGSALRKARKISPTKGIANIAKREKNKGAKQLDALMKEIAIPLRTYVENFPNKTYLHPYERSLIELTLGDGYYEQVLQKVDGLRKRVVSVGKEHASLLR
ncbi:nucleolar GTP-binding protein [Spatholobus suberectus]|nr:nucleolar GTP-binding protein [Spatholobus suberectus]